MSKKESAAFNKKLSKLKKSKLRAKKSRRRSLHNSQLLRAGDDEDCIGRDDPITFDTITADNVFEFRSSNGVKQCFDIYGLYNWYKTRYFANIQNFKNPVTNEVLAPSDIERLKNEFIRRGLEVSDEKFNEVVETPYGYKITLVSDYQYPGSAKHITLNVYTNTRPQTLVLTTSIAPTRQFYFERLTDINVKKWKMYTMNNGMRNYTTQFMDNHFGIHYLTMLYGPQFGFRVDVHTDDNIGDFNLLLDTVEDMTPQAMAIARSVYRILHIN